MLVRMSFSPYICNVFFIVLDLRLSKGWVKALTLFFMSFRFCCTVSHRSSFIPFSISLGFIVQ